MDLTRTFQHDNYELLCSARAVDGGRFEPRPGPPDGAGDIETEQRALPEDKAEAGDVHPENAGPSLEKKGALVESECVPENVTGVDLAHRSQGDAPAESVDSDPFLLVELVEGEGRDDVGRIDPAEIEAYVVYLQEHPEEEHRIRQSARRTARRFTWGEVTKDLIQKLTFQARVQGLQKQPEKAAASSTGPSEYADAVPASEAVPVPSA